MCFNPFANIQPRWCEYGVLYNDIALAFQKAGYDVVVLSTTPHFNVVEEQLAEQPMKWGVWGLYKKSLFHGSTGSPQVSIPVYHVPQKKFKSTPLRLIGFVYWHIVSFFVGLFIKNVDVIVSPSPPLTIGRLNNWLGKLKGCKVVYNVQEIYPDILNKLETSLVHRYLRGMEKRVYNNSAAVTTIDQVFYDKIVERCKMSGGSPVAYIKDVLCSLINGETDNLQLIPCNWVNNK